MHCATCMAIMDYNENSSRNVLLDQEANPVYHLRTTRHAEKKTARPAYVAQTQHWADEGNFHFIIFID